MSTVVIDPSTVSLIPGRTVQLDAVKLDSEGTVEAGSGFGWSVDDPTVARVDDSGEVLALKAGTARVFADKDGVTGEAEVRVVLDDNVASVTVTPGSLNLAVGDVARLSAHAYNAYGEEVTGELQFWSSSDISVASVDSSGLVTAGESGTADVSVEIGAITASVQVTVA